MPTLNLGFFDSTKSPDFSIERVGNRIAVDFSYILDGPSPFQGDVEINIGSTGRNRTINSNNNNNLDLSFDVAVAPAKVIKGSYTMNDQNSGTTLSLDFSLIRYDEAGRFRGSDGSDVAFGSNFHDVLMGNKGRDYLAGNAGADDIEGGGNNDKLFGGLGRDTLSGDFGDDQFFFTNEKFKGRSVDKITDFDASHETIWLDTSTFWALPSVKSPKEITKEMFTSNNLGIAQDSNDRVIYERDTGKVLFDEDGRGGSAAIAFADLDSRLRIEADNFMMY